MLLLLVGLLGSQPAIYHRCHYRPGQSIKISTYLHYRTPFPMTQPPTTSSKTQLRRGHQPPSGTPSCHVTSRRMGQNHYKEVSYVDMMPFLGKLIHRVAIKIFRYTVRSTNCLKVNNGGNGQSHTNIHRTFSILGALLEALHFY